MQAFTWARKPQKSQIRSAHLKLVGRRLSVRVRLHLGQAQSCATKRSPISPVICCSVATMPQCRTPAQQTQGSDQAADHASMIRQARAAAVIGRSTAPHLSQHKIRPPTSRPAGSIGVACSERSKSPPTLSPSGSDLMPVARMSKSSRTWRPAGRFAMGIRLRSRLCSTRVSSGISPKNNFARQSAVIRL